MLSPTSIAATTPQLQSFHSLASQVCKTWKMITDMHEDYLWKRLVYQFFTFCPDAPQEEVLASLYSTHERDSLTTRPAVAAGRAQAREGLDGELEAVLPAVPRATPAPRLLSRTGARPLLPHAFRPNGPHAALHAKQHALGRHRWNQRQTAKALGLSYDQLRHCIRKHGLAERGGEGDPASAAG